VTRLRSGPTPQPAEHSVRGSTRLLHCMRVRKPVDIPATGTHLLCHPLLNCLEVCLSDQAHLQQLLAQAWDGVPSCIGSLLVLQAPG
jgi:hypothetical protein